MLTQITIKNIVLIDQLTLTPGTTLTTLTGETGAGKSILLDSLGLALGARADAGLVRSGTDKGQVTAIFECDSKHPAFKLLADQDIECDDGQIIMRRSLTSDGRSKAMVNDQPVSVGFLKKLGATLVEIHGQFDTSGLLDGNTHRKTLDRHGGLGPNVKEVSEAFEKWQDARDELFNARSRADDAKTREDYIRFCIEELDKLAPEPGEERTLTETRARLMHREKISDAYNQLNDVIEGEDGLYRQIGRALSAIEKIIPVTGQAGEDIQSALNRAQIEIEEAEGHLQNLVSDDEGAIDPNEIEERLFALKDCARKHNCDIDDLADKHDELRQELGLIDDLESTLNALENQVKQARTAYYDAALALRQKRQTAATGLSDAVMRELPDLKLDKARFQVSFTALEDESDWTAHGIDRIRFEISTNPGTPMGALNKIASGGELARFMLALKLVLAKTSSVPTLVFDEVDSGVGGATADAVGLRLKQLSQTNQILVVTHSAQVAAKGDQQLQISKSDDAQMTTTTVRELSADDRLEEIARMISGAEITSEARAAAARLIGAKAA